MNQFFLNQNIYLQDLRSGLEDVSLVGLKLATSRAISEERALKKCECLLNVNVVLDSIIVG